MSTPEPRPPLADTLARIDQALAEQEPDRRVLHIDPAVPRTVFELAGRQLLEHATAVERDLEAAGVRPEHLQPSPRRPGWLSRLRRLFP